MSPQVSSRFQHAHSSQISAEGRQNGCPWIDPYCCLFMIGFSGLPEWISFLFEVLPCRWASLSKACDMIICRGESTSDLCSTTHAIAHACQTIVRYYIQPFSRTYDRFLPHTSLSRTCDSFSRTCDCFDRPLSDTIVPSFLFLLFIVFGKS